MFHTFAVTFSNTERAHTFTASFFAHAIPDLWENIRGVRMTSKEYGYKITKIVLVE